MFIKVFLALTIALAAGGTPVERVAAMEKQYDPAAAETLAQELRQCAEIDANERNLLLARCALCVAEMLRIDFERVPSEERPRRQELGKAIDKAANEALADLANAPETSETWRVRADAYGVKIRSNYQAQRYHRDMEQAIARALELDPKNARAVVSSAKPFLFADEDHGGDLAHGLAIIENALKLDPALEEAQLLRAFALHVLGKDAEATEAYRKVLADNPACAPARYELARAQH